MQHSLIRNHIEIINITITAYIWQSYISFHLQESHIPHRRKQNN